jgi:hypothetical protein
MLDRHERLLRAARARASGTPGPQGPEGPEGPPGATGPSGTIEGATATGLPAGSAPTVTPGGTATARTFEFGIPAGAKGDKGDTGNTGPAGPAVDPASDLTVARLRLTALEDASETSTAHPFQIGPSSALNVIIDTNEIIPRNNGALGALGLGGARIVNVGAPIGTTDAATFGSVTTIRSEAAAPYATGWAAWADGVYQDLRFWMDRDGWITVSGLARYNGGTGATVTICTLSSTWAPLNGSRHVLSANINDTARWVNVQATSLVLRGALPTVGQYVAINGRYPGPTVTV